MEQRTHQEGALVLNKRYRITQLIYQRPRLNLYLAQRVLPHASDVREKKPESEGEEPFVAIRELLLEGLPSSVRRLIEAAAAYESFSTAMPGASLLESGERVRVEEQSHYLVMQLHLYQSDPRPTPVTLAQLLLQPEWPSWLTLRVALDWSIQLFRSVARLHRLGVLFGDLSPATLLVNQEGVGNWAPIPLICWPPAPHFWQQVEPQLQAYDLYDSLFPIASPARDHVFVAPELFQGICDERSDVYSLGAILYLLLTRYAPASASHRLNALYQSSAGAPPLISCSHELTTGLELTLPRFMRPEISPLLEQVLLRALEVHNECRYQSVFELVEALEALEQVESRSLVLPQLRKNEGMCRLLRQIIRL